MITSRRRAGDGNLYIADSGAESEPNSGRLVQVSAGGTVTTIVESISNFTGDPYGQTYLFGLSDIAANSDTLYVVLGLAAQPADET